MPSADLDVEGGRRIGHRFKVGLRTLLLGARQGDAGQASRDKSPGESHEPSLAILRTGRSSSSPRANITRVLLVVTLAPHRTDLPYLFLSFDPLDRQLAEALDLGLVGNLVEEGLVVPPS